MKTSIIIMAAGQGTRMRSAQPKVLHKILGKSLIWLAADTALKASGEKPIVIVGHGADGVRQALGHSVRFVVQPEQLGTAHAVLQAESALRGRTDQILVTSADMPLIRPETLRGLVEAQETHTGPITMLTAEPDEPRGFGRVVRARDGSVSAIVEQVDATPDQLAIRELNTATYCFSESWLWQALKNIELSPKGEYYLTDLVGIAVSEGESVQAIELDDPTEMIGINNRVHLAEATAAFQKRINREWMLAGVTLIDPASTYIEPGVTIGQDTVIWPNTYLQGTTQIGANCVLGPNSVIRDSKLGDRCQVFSSVVERALLEDGVDIGPFGHLRKGAHLAEGVHMGNFGEIKNSYLGPGTKMGHFSYLGDAEIGPNVNIGAGTITCNYDGENKHPTKIGADVFIGSDSMLVAPLTMGDRSRTGAGSVVTKDVPDDTLVVGIPARAIKKLKKKE